MMMALQTQSPLSMLGYTNLVVCGCQNGNKTKKWRLQRHLSLTLLLSITAGLTSHVIFATSPQSLPSTDAKLKTALELSILNA